MMPLAVLLSIYIGAAGCGCPKSLHVTLSGSNFLAFMYNAPISASVAEDITLFIIFAIIDIGPFIICCCSYHFLNMYIQLLLILPLRQLNMLHLSDCLISYHLLNIVLLLLSVLRNSQGSGVE